MAHQAHVRPSFSPFPEEPVRLAVMHQRWDRLTFLHWAYEASVVQRLLPRHLELDVYDGVAWVGLTPFEAGVQPPHVPFGLRFPETNVRTYVRGPAGKRGVWFFSLDAVRLAAVLGARTLYRLPYMWSRMDVTADANQVRYRSRRIWPGPGPTSDVLVCPGASLGPGRLSDFDHFLTARWRLYTTFAGRLASATIEHPPWPLAQARVIQLQQDLLMAAGLPQPSGDPVVHYSTGVQVRVGPLLPV